MSPPLRKTGPSGRPADATPVHQDPTSNLFLYAEWTTGSGLPVIAFCQDTDLHYTWISRPFLGHPVERIVGRRDRELIGRVAQAERIETLKRRVLATARSLRADVALHVEGVRHDYELAVAPWWDEAGEMGGLIGSFYDITERKSTERRLQHQAHYDPLTHLPNRTLLLDRLAHSLHQARRRHRKVAVLYFDLDRFKLINGAPPVSMLEIKEKWPLR